MTMFLWAYYLLHESQCFRVTDTFWPLRAVKQLFKGQPKQNVTISIRRNNDAFLIQGIGVSRTISLQSTLVIERRPVDYTMKWGFHSAIRSHFLPLDETIASRTVFVIVSDSGRTVIMYDSRTSAILLLSGSAVCLWKKYKVITTMVTRPLNDPTWERFSARITKFHTVVGDNWPHKSAEYDVASYFRSAAKCN